MATCYQTVAQDWLRFHCLIASIMEPPLEAKNPFPPCMLEEKIDQEPPPIEFFCFAVLG